MKLIFDTNGNEKQKECARAWLDNSITEIIYGGSKGSGKAQRLTEPVLTPFGWKEIGKLRIGSLICNPNGTLQTVIAIHDHKKKKMYEVVLDDGSKTYACDEHLWLVRTSKKTKKNRVKQGRYDSFDGKIMTTLQIKEHIDKDTCSLLLPNIQPQQFTKTYKTNQIRIKPYTLGVLLGDGCLRNGQLAITTPDKEVIEGIRADGYDIRKRKAQYAYGIVNSNLREQLTYYGIYDTYSYEKHVPKYYLWSSIETRTKLLQGLLDTDGYVDKIGAVSFSSSSKQLAEDVQFLVRSLGGRASITKSKAGYKKDNVYVDCKDSYTVHLTLPNDSDFLTVMKKKERCRKRKVLNKRIISVRYVGEEPARCITVNDPNRLYITSDFITTHNSYLGISLIFGDAFLHDDTHYFIAREALNDLRRFTIPSIMEVFKHWGIHESLWRLNGQDNYFELHNKSRVYLLDAKYLPSDPLYQRFGSMQMTRGWIEEAGQFDVHAKQNLQASIGRKNNDKHNLVPKLLQTCNPSKNYLYESYKKWKAGELENYISFIQALPTDNKMLPEGYIDNLERSLDPVSKERLLFGNWEYDDDPNSLIEYDAIIDLFTNKVAEGESWITADIARLGEDRTVIYVWKGYQITDIVYYTKQELTTTAERIKALAEANQVPRSRIIVDEDGLGGGVKDILKCKGFIANSRPQKDENYTNLKTQCYYRLAQKINARLISINCQDDKVKQLIIEELEQVKSYKPDDDKKVRILPKDNIKQLIGRSPDFADAMAMRMWEAPKFGFGVDIK